MVLHLFVFLLMVCLLLSLALLWRLYWLHQHPSSPQGGAKRSTLHRLLNPRCPDPRIAQRDMTGSQAA
jgi:hypothetical protein